MAGGSGPVAQLAKSGLVTRRHIGRNEFALAACERVGLVEQDVRQRPHRLGCFWTERKSGSDAGKFFGKFDMRHGGSSGAVLCSLFFVLSFQFIIRSSKFAV